MKPIKKASNIAQDFVPYNNIESRATYEEVREACMQMHNCTEEYMLKQLEVWEDYYLNYKRFEVADALEEIINWFRSPDYENTH